jgi:hypothetical protein
MKMLLKLPLMVAVAGLHYNLAQAAVMMASEDAELFGTLNQANTEFNCSACGPAAAVNSFVYLQNKFPKNYPDHALVPTTNGNKPTQPEQAAIANMLGGPNFMNSKAGTQIENFIVGKQKYLDGLKADKKAGATAFAVQMNSKWRTDIGGVKPGYVQDLTIPTESFIYDQIKAGEDVEILVVTADLKFSHYLTITSISFDTETSKGTMGLVDPLGGGRVTDDILGLGNKFIKLDYMLNMKPTFISAAVAESASMPEPGTLVVLTCGLLGLALARRSTGSAADRVARDDLRGLKADSSGQ